MPWDSEIRFVSFLQYSPHGTSEISRRSKRTCIAIKTDGTIPIRSKTGNREFVRVIKYSVKRLSESIQDYPFLADCFGSEATLIPIPRSAPQKDQESLWPARTICQALIEEGISPRFLPLLMRIKPVRESKSAGKGERPSPEIHYESLAIAQNIPLLVPSRIVLVDDVITRGSTFMGSYHRVKEAFPNSQVTCFAMVRTMSSIEISTMLEPVEGVIGYSGGRLSRRP